MAGYYEDFEPEKFMPKINVETRKRLGAKAPRINEQLARTLLHNDIRRNRNLANIEGAKRYASKHKRRHALIDDINSDGVPEVIIGYDDNNDQKIDKNEYTHVNGYYLAKTDWPYRARYWADRARNPKAFRNAKMGMAQYVEAMHPQFERDPDTGKVRFDRNDTGLQAFNRSVSARGGMVREPRDLNNMQLWKMHIFDPVYYAMVDGVVADGQQLKMDQSFRYIVVSGKCYKDLVSYPLLRQALGFDPLNDSLTDDDLKMINKVKASKQFKEHSAKYINKILQEQEHGWNQVYSWLVDVYQQLNLHHMFGSPREITISQINNVYKERREARNELNEERRNVYGKLEYARNLEFDSKQWPVDEERYAGREWNPGYSAEDTYSYVMRTKPTFRYEERDERVNYYAQAAELHAAADQASRRGEHEVAANLRAQADDLEEQGSEQVLPKVQPKKKGMKP
jgi:hypothetical protein